MKSIKKIQENNSNLGIEIKIETDDDSSNIKREVSEDDDNYRNDDDFDYTSNNKDASENALGWKFDSMEENDNKFSVKDEDSSDSKPLNTFVNVPVTPIINVPVEGTYCICLSLISSHFDCDCFIRFFRQTVQSETRKDQQSFQIEIQRFVFGLRLVRQRSEKFENS